VDCKRVEGELVAFQLAALDGATRAAVETHLVGCGRCVGQLLALKRAVDAGDDVSEGPSVPAQQRLMSAAAERARELARVAQPPAESARDRRHAQLLYFAVAALLFLAVAPFAWRAAHVPARGSSPKAEPSPPPPSFQPSLPTEQVDTARITPDNLRFL
jgi:hypothetical protein